MHVEWMYVSVGVIGVHVCVCVWLLSITNIKGNSDFFALLRRAHGVVHQPTHMCIQARAQDIPANSLQVASYITNR